MIYQLTVIQHCEKDDIADEYEEYLKRLSIRDSHFCIRIDLIFAFIFEKKNRTVRNKVVIIIILIFVLFAHTIRFLEYESIIFVEAIYSKTSKKKQVHNYSIS
jgi:hypothetical protein